MRHNSHRILILVICLSLFSFSFVYAEESSIYPDIQEHAAREAIEALYETGAINYSKDEPLNPDQPISRVQFLFMLLSTKGITPQTDIKQTDFTDVTKDDWFFPYVETAYQLGIILGESPTKTFLPNEEISRQEAILMLLRMLGEGEVAKQYKEANKELAEYSDASNVASWAKNSFAYAVNKKYFEANVTDNGSYLYPNQSLTKAEAATLVYNTLYQRLFLDTLQKDDVDAKPITYFSKLDVKAVAYNVGEHDVGAYSRTGLSVRYGLVAVDPKVIPLGTHLYIPGYGFAIAADTGGAIKGAMVDLYMINHEDAIKFGKKDAVVYILDPINIQQK